MLVKMYIVISENERQAIQEIAEKELRPFREQVRLLLRQELQRRGLLTGNSTQIEHDGQAETDKRKLDKDI